MSKDSSRDDIEKKLVSAVEHITPDIKSSILGRCKNTESERPIMVVTPSKKTKVKLNVYRFISAAAILLLAVNLGLLARKTKPDEAVAAVIDIDVNPSIELSVSSEDKIVEAKAVNDDALEILDGMDLKGTQTKVAINAIMGSMLEHGYLEEETKYVLVSVASKDTNDSKVLEKKITDDIGDILGNYSVEACVIAQTFEDDSDISNIADDYGISQGKATLISRIMSLDESYYYDELSIMSLSELDALLMELEAKGIKDDDVTTISVVESKTSEDDATSAVADDTIDVSASSNSVSENVVDSIDDEDISVSSNTVSSNTISSNSISENSVSDNAVSGNSVNEDIYDNEL